MQRNVCRDPALISRKASKIGLDPLVAIVDQAGQITEIISADPKARARLPFHLPAPAPVNCAYRSVGANQSDLLDEPIDDFLNFLKGAKACMPKS